MGAFCVLLLLILGLYFSLLFQIEYFGKLALAYVVLLAKKRANSVLLATNVCQHNVLTE